jgi:hypothetical protein
MQRTLPQKLTELGRIRIGDREPNSNGRGTHPHKLNAFRLTSQNRSLLGFAAQLYGGSVEEWDGEGAPHDEYGRATHYELYTEANSIDVLIPTMSAVSLSYEAWSAGGCQRRCTGEVITHCPDTPASVGEACRCPADDLARAEAAKNGNACARILRLQVLLPDLPGIGTWRLETKGFYASAELLGTLNLLQHAGAEHTIIEAVLRLEQRTIKRHENGKALTMRFSVPVLWPKWTPRQLLTGASNVLLTPATLPAPHAQHLTQNIALLYGDSGQTEDDPLVLKITELLASQGLTHSEITDWWARMDRKYAGRTPFTLNMLYERLVAAVKTPRKTAEDAPGSTNAPGGVSGEGAEDDPCLHDDPEPPPIGEHGDYA